MPEITDKERMDYIEENAVIFEASKFENNKRKKTRLSATVFLPYAPSIRQAIDKSILENEEEK